MKTPIYGPTAGKLCEVHKYHWPKPIRIVTHEILPQAMGGLVIPDNQIDTCDTGHYNIHRLLGMLIKDLARGTLGTKYERKLALDGYRAWVNAGKPGRPVFEMTSYPIIGEPLHGPTEPGSIANQVEWPEPGYE